MARLLTQILYNHLILTCFLILSHASVSYMDFNETAGSSHSNRKLITTSSSCDFRANQNPGYTKYFKGIGNIYNDVNLAGTCLKTHQECGWPARDTTKNLPMFVLSVGLEGAGHHLWTELMNSPVFDCVWINGRHYNRNIGDGVARRHREDLAEGFREQFRLRRPGRPCR